jgi:hypothetical protein
MQEGGLKDIIRTMGKKIEYEHPENLGCTRAGDIGTFCAINGCYAKYLLENSKDIEDPVIAERSRKGIIKVAKAAGCKCDFEIIQP